MSFENTPLRDYYFLKEKNSFSLDPWSDRAVYFGDTNFAERISGRIERDFLEPRAVPKFFVHGNFGSGKTHTLLHIAYQLENRFRAMYPTEPIYLDIAPLGSKERWIRIHAKFMDALGLDRIRDAAEQAADSLEERDKAEGFAGVLRFGEEALKKSQAQVLRNLLFGGRQMHLSWEWMKGRKTSVDDSQMLGTQKQLEEPQDFVHCLLNLGVLFQRASGSRLVFLIDEGEAFRAISNPDSQAEVIHAVRMLLDNTNSYIGFVFAVHVEGDPEEGGFLFQRDDIRRRVGYDQGYIDLNNLLARIEDSESFIQGTLGYLVDQEKAEIAITKESLNTTPEFFPFTEDAVRAIAGHVRDLPERAGPSAILSYMSNGAIEAWRRRTESQIHQVVDEEIIEATIYPEESE